MKRLLLLLVVGFSTFALSAGNCLSLAVPSARLLSGKWKACWICDGDSPAVGYGVYRFRKHFSLACVPDKFVINISADNRYRLYVNGEEACHGPARGSLDCWYYETVDISGMLRQGDNVLAVTVWNMGAWAPVAQISCRTGLIVQGDTPAEECINTDSSWLVFRDDSFSPVAGCPEIVFLGGQERIEGKMYPWGWETTGFDDSGWKRAEEIAPGKTYGSDDYGEYAWVLTPRDIPMMEQSLQRLESVRRYSGLPDVPDFIRGGSPLKIPAGTKCSLLLDQGFLTTAYPHMVVSGGEGSVIRITYAEALVNNAGKGNRDDIEGRKCYGYYDEFLPDGGDRRMFSPLWFRTYRYVQLDIQTYGSALVIEDMYGIYTAYPFKECGAFSSDDPSLDVIWDTGWRTARLCAHETYFDCPYYEQLQYAGDTRIQSLISLYVSGDDRLMRKAIRMFDVSRGHEGITGSRYPSRVLQYIPQFSLYWIGMVHDYWLYRSDEGFVKSFLPGIRTVLSWFTEKIDPETGMIMNGLPHWNFTDWVDGWERGVAPESESSGSAVTSLLFAAALDDAAQLMRYYGSPYDADKYEMISSRLKTSVYARCWDASKGLLMDYAGGRVSSQHVNIMGVLTDAIPRDAQKDVLERICNDSSLAKTTLYYKFYLFRALKKAGLADWYLDMLGPWRDMIDIGLTTFAETQEPTRSDCHAWSSSPNFDLLSIVCGVEPLSPGFATVRVEPHPGYLHRVCGTVPHPKGDISVELNCHGRRISGIVSFPEGLVGEFVWRGKKMVLSSGENLIDL